MALVEVCTAFPPLRVYVAAPYTTGDAGRNVRRAILAADAILEAGHLPYLPHLNHFWHILRPHFKEAWMELDHAWLIKCDVLVRLPGESEGADREVKWAQAQGMEVFYGL